MKKIKIPVFVVVLILGFSAYIGYTGNKTEVIEFKETPGVETALPPVNTPAKTNSPPPAIMTPPATAEAAPAATTTLPLSRPRPPAKTALTILEKVAFTSQAPTGHWDDIRQQDGCEETVALMAVTWAKDEKLPTGAKAEQAIIAIADWQDEKYGNFHDTSLSDTAERILKGYFSFNKFTLLENITGADIKRELAAGNIVITPMNGVKLDNPHYTPPGPLHHMILIIGYDKVTKEFITNDPGTRVGKQYRYAEDILIAAIRDYPTGNHEPVSLVKKNMIVVRPNHDD